MYRVYAAIGLLMLGTTSTAQQNTLTETTAIRLALSRDAVQQRAEGNLSQARSDVIAAGTRPNPEFSYERETLDNEEDHVEQKFVVSQRFDFSGRRSLHMQAADRHLDAVRYESDAWRADLTKDVRERFYRALLQQQRRVTYQTTQDRIRLLSEALQKRRREGDVSIYDYQRVSTERAAIEAEVRNADVDLDAARQNLSVLLGGDSGGFRSLEGELLPGEPAAREQLLSAVDAQPALRRLQEQSEAFGLQQRAESRTFPDVTLGLGLKREETNDQSDNGLVINASIPIPVFDKRKDKQARYQAQALIARSEYELARDTARAELEGVWRQVTQYQSSAATFRRDAVQGAQELIGIAEAYYRAGEVGILELLDAYRGALDAELNALDLEFKARSARIQLDHLTGGAVQ